MWECSGALGEPRRAELSLGGLMGTAGMWLWLLGDRAELWAWCPHVPFPVLLPQPHGPKESPLHSSLTPVSQWDTK